MVETNGKIKVLLVDPHPVVRIGLRCILEGEEIEVVGAIGTGGALSTIEKTQPDVIVIDLGRGGISVVAEVLAEYPDVSILVFTDSHNAHVSEAIQAGALGYLMKGCSPSIIRQGVLDVAAGLSPISPEAGRVLVDKYANLAKRVYSGVLSDREVDILLMVAEGKTGTEMSRALSYSTSTIKRVIRKIFNKLGTNDRASAVAEGIRRGLI